MVTRRINTLRAVSLTKAMPPGMHSDGGGLYLQVSDTGARSWIFRYSRNGKAHYHGLGPLQTISLAQARERGREPAAIICLTASIRSRPQVEARRATAPRCHGNDLRRMRQALYRIA
jgi:Arm DNA-binding domain